MHRIWYHWYICWNGEPGSRLYLFIYIIHIAAYSRWTLTFGSRKLVYLRIYAQNLVPLVLWYIHWDVDIHCTHSCIFLLYSGIGLQKACILAYIYMESGTTGVYPGMLNRAPDCTGACRLYVMQKSCILNILAHICTESGNNDGELVV